MPARSTLALVGLALSTATAALVTSPVIRAPAVAARAQRPVMLAGSDVVVHSTAALLSDASSMFVAL